MKIDFSQVVESYNGQHGCICGCRGHSHAKDSDHSGAIRIVNRMNKLIKAGYSYTTSEDKTEVKTISRTYIAYYKKPNTQKCAKFR
jgi:hypothetical protein